MTGISALKRLQSPAAPSAGVDAQERCEFCGVTLSDASGSGSAGDERHGHVADVRDHRLVCVCRPCYLLFAPRGAGGGRYKGVGEEVRRVDVRLEQATWDLLRIPVDLVFFLVQDGQVHCFYPSPAGATESELDMSAWERIAADNAGLAEIEPDVEAVLLRRLGPQEFSCHVVPVDRCYELVGLVRSRWAGLSGGNEVWATVADFFTGLAARRGRR